PGIGRHVGQAGAARFHSRRPPARDGARRALTPKKEMLMLTRRLILGAGLATGTLALGTAARAAGWRDKYPEIVLAVVPPENPSGVTERYAPFVEYLSKELGVKVTLRVANDYAAVIEGQRNDSIHIRPHTPPSPSPAPLPRL